MSALYDKYRERALSPSGAGVDWLVDEIRAVLVDLNDYTPNMATDEFLADIPLAARVAVSAALTNKTALAGVADADDAVFTGVTGDTCEALALYKWTGSAATSRLIALIDDAAGLPFTPSPTGGNTTVVWGNGSNKIYKL